MTADLGEFLRAAASRRREAGVWDCCTMPAAWAEACGWGDLMADYRAAYASESEAEAIVSGAGGLLPLFCDAMAAAGVPELVDGEFLPGDVGVVELLGEQAGALYTGKRWALVASRGMAFASLDRDALVRVWRVGNG